VTSAVMGVVSKYHKSATFVLLLWQWKKAHGPSAIAPHRLPGDDSGSCLKHWQTSLLPLCATSGAWPSLWSPYPSLDPLQLYGERQLLLLFFPCLLPPHPEASACVCVCVCVCVCMCACVCVCMCVRAYVQVCITRIIPRDLDLISKNSAT
jgi:hypothetical protein